MLTVRYLATLLVGVLLLQGNLELGTLACVVRHRAEGVAVDETHRDHAGTRGSRVSGTVAGAADRLDALPGSTRQRDAVPCGSGPMTPGHCAAMHGGPTAAVSAPTSAALFSGASHPHVIAHVERPSSRAVAPDVPPPRA